MPAKHQPRPVDRLAPLSDDLPSEIRQLAEFLRERFAELDKTIRSYAKEKNWDAGAISRYLSGERVVPWDFLTFFLEDAALQREHPISLSEIEQAKNLRMEALRVSNDLLYKVEDLRGQLEAAKVEKVQAEERLTILFDLMKALRNEVGGVQSQRLELESSWGRRALTAPRGSELELYETEKQALVHTEGGLESEIERLKLELDQARGEKEKADQKCIDLEAALSEPFSSP